MLKPTEYRKSDRRARPGGTERHGRPLIRATSLPAVRPRRGSSRLLGPRAPSDRPQALAGTRRLHLGERALPRAAGARPRGSLGRVIRPRLRLVSSNPEVVPERSAAGLRLVPRGLGRALARQARRRSYAAEDAVSARRTGEYVFVLGLAVTGLLALITSLRQLLG
ncbi:MAG TPA: hypothetical protein VEI94_14835 [Candidatus Bathyarchaeia archaeon]|nr:hypothetical protein [Candidatus Bathyarchaeia archaeon]